jgi:Family of unknown function (DUF6156)
MRDAGIVRYFTAYTGVNLPFHLVGELAKGETHNRNTYFEGRFDACGVLQSFRKMVYGEVELEHQYHYSDAGALLRAEITDADGEVTVMERG